jgi:hypothetical protein
MCLFKEKKTHECKLSLLIYNNNNDGKKVKEKRKKKQLTNKSFLATKGKK